MSQLERLLLMAEDELTEYSTDARKIEKLRRKIGISVSRQEQQEIKAILLEEVPQAGLSKIVEEQRQTVALPFWGEFMSSVYDSVSFNRGRFVDSPGVFEIEICLETKQLATAYCPNTKEEMFTSKNKPEESCEIHKGFETGSNKRRRSF